MKSFLQLNLQVLNPRRDLSITRYRLILATLLVLILATVVLFRLYVLQVVNYDRYKTLSVENRVGLVPVPPVRGQIIDRNGKILADNYPVYELELVSDQIQDVDQTLRELEDLISFSDRELNTFRQQLHMRPSFEPLVLKHSLSLKEASIISVNQHRFPGVALRASLRRTYPYAGLAAHVVGYVSRISEEDIRNIDTSAYQGTRYIGKTGIEQKYEDKLLGLAGYESVESNAHGRIVRSLNYQSPMAGWNVNLTLDIDLQRVAREALGDHRGSVVALHPTTGDVLALVSAPDYDPNLFSTGFPFHSYNNLRDSPDKPLMNRALYGRYAPGSIIKPILAIAAIDQGLDSSKTVLCTGKFRLPGRDRPYRCWKRDGHGEINVLEAIEQSCDVFFYQSALNLGIDDMATWFRRFGLGKKTGIDLKDEAFGLVPDREWKKSSYNEAWFPGETVITGIGQGYLLATPMQLAVATGALANGGDLVQPRLLAYLENAESGEIVMGPEVRVVAKIQTDDSLFDWAVEGMIQVIHGLRGTARALADGLPYRMAGKTGTSQLVSIEDEEGDNPVNLPDRLKDHALFVAFAPVENPRIVLAIVVENAGSGSRAAAPIARKILDYYFIERLRRANVSWKVIDFG